MALFSRCETCTCFLTGNVRTLLTGDALASCVCLSVTRLCLAKTAVRIEVLFGVETGGDARPIVLDGGPDPPTVGGAFIQCGLFLITLATSE